MNQVGVAICVGTMVLALVASVVFIIREKESHRLPPEPSPREEKTTPTLVVETARPMPKPNPFVPAPADRAAVAMNETIVKSMIDNIRIACARGDSATANAVAKGLRNYCPAAIPLLEAEIASAADPEIKHHLEEILIALPGETK